MADKLRILEAFGEPIADGGQEAFVFGVMSKMNMDGLVIDCLTAYDCLSNHYKGMVERMNGKVYALNLPFAPGKSRSNIRKPFTDFLKNHFYDVVHIHSGSISVLAIMASVAGKAGVKKIIVHSHASGDSDNLKHRVLRKLASVCMAPCVDTYCACSKDAAEWKFEPKYAKTALIIKNGIDTERFSYNSSKRQIMREKLGVEGAFVIGHVGRFTREKNHRFLIDVFEDVAEREPAATLLLVGAGELAENIKTLVAEKGLKDRVIFAGSVTDVEDYLQAMDVFVMPSLYEGLGIAAVEAQCCGLPVAASDSVPEDIKLTDDVTFISLETGEDVWAERILSYRVRKRQGNEKIVKDSGYDMNQTAEIVRGLYIDDGSVS